MSACRVKIDWLSVKRSLANSVSKLASLTGRGSELTTEDLERTADSVATGAVIYVLEFIPEAFDLALSSLCFEAVVARSASLDRPWIKSAAESLARMDYDAMLRWLEVQLSSHWTPTLTCCRTCSNKQRNALKSFYLRESECQFFG
jgi:hypothetical protein